MAALDVSDVLDDPDFHTEIQLMPSAVETGVDGIADAYPAATTFIGVVIPDGGQDLIRSGEGDQVEGDITIYTRQILTTGNAIRGADVIQWNGDPYTVIQAQPWLYGDGYYRAVCKLGTLNPSEVPADRNAGFLGQR